MVLFYRIYFHFTHALFSVGGYSVTPMKCIRTPLHIANQVEVKCSFYIVFSLPLVSFSDPTAMYVMSV